MHGAVSDIIEFVSSHLGPDFHMEILQFKNQSRDPFEKKTKNRFDLRSALYNHLKDKKNFVFEDALDLRNVPQKIGAPNKDYYSSLSHTEELGVFALDSSPIGVDFENTSRVQKEVVQRVCQDSEMSLTPFFQQLWSIKEAAFKSIPFIIQPKTVSDITIEKINSVTATKLPSFQVSEFLGYITKSPATRIQGISIWNETNQLAIAKALIKK